MTDELSVLKLVAARFDRAGIAYMVTGSIALGFYAEPRMTRDIDLVVEIDPASAGRITALFGREFLLDEATVAAAAARQTMFNAIHMIAAVKVDVMVRKDVPYRIEEFRRRRQVNIDDQMVWFVSPEDLILSKLYWTKDSPSELQLRDVRTLLRDVPGLDHAYLDRWASQLQIARLLDEVRQS